MKKYPEGGIKYVIKKDVCGRVENAILDKIPCFDSDCCWYQSYPYKKLAQINNCVQNPMEYLRMTSAIFAGFQIST